MAVIATTEVTETQTWPQGDIRDPLGVWGARGAMTGDATGDDIVLLVNVPLLKRKAFLYTVNSAMIGQIVGTGVVGNVSARIISNFPNIDLDAGVVGFSKVIGRSMTDLGTAAPFFAPDDPLIEPNDRFIVCYDPSPVNPNPMTILELKFQVNTDARVWVGEAYGYYWDRSVMNAPGGPRFPGQS